ncbi:hypothetical protein BEWA_034370 [Theileria equi strain WA]|uniref:Uncharacterized protein n=1 Tax=Theileria equi strain WA TaxID=1537102 RepID=L0AYD5_THEEQ|nr:hypothetical protein BEWA_034370 [Theileria equi strain WA]AFZ80580.1 hypothetical protein BEWA_034370 [Theileria equi strain WA]|eukprot:XP_004830246.1 hypothetical protein BEWA_034370 [Theileria equi strain WA]
MLHSSRDASSSGNLTSVSVIDILLRGNFSECGKTEQNKRCRFNVTESGGHEEAESPKYKNHSHTTDDAVNDFSYNETRTPTTRLDQLPILLARNYFTAPACLLEFINTTSTIHHGTISNRDSDGTIIGYEDDQFESYNVDTNDELCDIEHLDSTSSEVLSNTLTRRTSLASNETVAESFSKNFVYFDANPIDNLQQNATSPSNFTDCEPECDSTGRSDSVNVTKISIDKGTSPLVIHENVQTLDPRNIGASHVKDIIIDAESPRTLDSPAKNSNCQKKRAIDEETDVESESCTKDPDTSLSRETKNEMPVYCRSLLYRIRVPLSKRLKNGPEEYLSNSDLYSLSISRTNLSCDRLFNSSKRSSESAYSVLRLSDLADDVTYSDSPGTQTFFKSNRIIENDGTYKNNLDVLCSEHTDRKNMSLYVGGRYLKPGKLTLLDGEGNNPNI